MTNNNLLKVKESKMQKVRHDCSLSVCKHPFFNFSFLLAVINSHPGKSNGEAPGP